MSVAMVPMMDSQQGQAIAEYVYVVPIMLLLILGAIQFGFIYQAKSTLNYATFVATRQGALKNGDMTEMQKALAGGLAPLFVHGRDFPKLNQAYAKADGELKKPNLTRIDIVNPTPGAWSAYKMPSSFDKNVYEIPNDNLMYRAADVVGESNMNLQDANLLKLRVTYCYVMIVPIINKIIYSSGSTSDACTNLPDDEYRIPISAEAVVRMQSPFRDPVHWSAP